MIKSLTKSRSHSDLLLIHMKFLLIAITGFCLWSNPDFRRFGADRLQDASDIMRPEYNEIKVTF